MSIENFVNLEARLARPRLGGCLSASDCSYLQQTSRLSGILRGADAPTTSVQRQKLKDLLPPSTVMACSGAEQREEPSNLRYSLALELPKCAPPDCSLFKLLTLRPLLIRKQWHVCQQFIDLNLLCPAFILVVKLSTMPRIMISARPYSTSRRKSRLFHNLAEKRLCFFRHAYMPRIRVS